MYYLDDFAPVLYTLRLPQLFLEAIRSLLGHCRTVFKTSRVALVSRYAQFIVMISGQVVEGAGAHEAIGDTPFSGTYWLAYYGLGVHDNLPEEITDQARDARFVSMLG